MAMPDEVTRDECRAVVETSLAQLLNLIGPDRRFVYAHRLGRPDEPLDGYNMLRHCGTLWFMLRAINEMSLAVDANVRQGLGRAVAYVTDRLQRPAWTPEPSLALVTRGVVKTGGVGLALLMLNEVGRMLAAGGEAPPSPVIAGLQAYALAQIDGHDFLHKRSMSDGAVLPFRSDYYTGEVLFGLFATGCRDARVIAVAEALVARRYGLAEHSHWMAYAACEAAVRGVVGPARLAGYLADLIGTIVAEPGYRARALSTPIACRTEALTRFLWLTDTWAQPFDPALRRAAMQAARENLSLQLQWYDRGAFAKGARDDVVQIDVIQHNASAFLNLWHCRDGVRP